MPLPSFRAALAAAIMLLVVATAAPALAHAQLLSTNPAANAVLSTAPDTVELGFNEPVGVLTMSLVDPRGGRADLLAGATSGEVVAVELPPLSDGTHVLSWRVISADGHPIPGSLVFSVGRVTGSATTASSSATDSMVAVSLWVARLMVYVGLFVGVGGAVFRALVAVPEEARRLAAAALGVGLVASVVSLGLQGLDALGLPLSDVAAVAPWVTGASTSYGPTVLGLCVALVLGGFALLLPRGDVGMGAALLAWVVGAGALSLSGHASAAEPQWLMRPAVFIHAAGIQFWVGALVPLLLLLRDRTRGAQAALGRFSRFIPYAIAPLVVAGLLLTVVQLGAPGPAWLGGYGIILAAKLGLLVLLFALALWNRLRLTRPTLRGDARARHRLHLSVRAEIVVVLVILGLVAGWRFTPPPRALAQVAEVVEAEPISVHFMDGKLMAMATIDPGGPGQVRMAIVLTDLAGEPLAAQAVGLTLAVPALGIEPFRHEAVMADGVWRIDDLLIPVAGDWHAELDIRLDRFTLTKLAAAFPVP